MKSTNRANNSTLKKAKAKRQKIKRKESVNELCWPTEEDKITATAETPRQARMTEHRTESAEAAASGYGQGDSNDNRKGNDGSCESGDALVSLNKSTAGPEALAYSTDQ